MEIVKRSPVAAPYLLIVNKGPGAVPLLREPSVDVLEVYFDPGQIEREAHATDADHVVTETDRSKRKFSILGELFARESWWRDYAAIMMADDDLAPVECSIREQFGLFALTGARVGQPALTRDSPFSHEITRRDARFLYRRASFVEVMCPVMTPAAIADYMPHFGESTSSFGLDNLWSYRELDAGRWLAMLDGTPMRHLRPIGGGIAYDGLAKSPIAEAEEMLARHGVPRAREHVCAGGVLASGRASP